MTSEERDTEIKRRAWEFFQKPENREVRLTPEEFMMMFDPELEKVKQ